jgi:hypothetical protein
MGLHAIIDEFIRPGADQEVNLRSDARTAILDTWDAFQKQGSRARLPDPGLFGAAREEIRRVLENDSFKRFQKCKAYGKVCFDKFVMHELSARGLIPSVHGSGGGVSGVCALGGDTHTRKLSFCTPTLQSKAKGRAKSSPCGGGGGVRMNSKLNLRLEKALSECD